MLTTKIQLASKYQELFNKKWRHIVYHGGRSSGKSTAAAYALLLRGRQSKLRILCTRELQNSIADSVHKLLKDIILQHNFTDYEVQREVIRNRVTGTEFIFKGLRKDSQAIKSMEGIDLCWIEEAQTITRGSIDILIPTIRKLGSQLIWTFNRLTELDPVWVKLCLNPDPDTFICHVNSDTLEEIGQLPQVMIDEREKMRKNEPSLFPHVWLGEPMSQVDDAIIGREAIMEAMQREVEPEGAIEIGVDVARMGNDRTEFVKRKGLKEIGRQTFQKLRTTEVVDKLEEFAGYDKSILIKVDDTGVGCITHDTSVLTPNGWRYPQELMKGDEVYSKDEAGNVITTTVFSVDERQSAIIEAGGYKFAWAHQLPFKTRNNYDYKLGTWEQATDYKQAIFDTVFSYDADEQDFYLPEQSITMPYGGTKIINKENTVDAHEFAILLGWYVSEGSIDRSSGCIMITQKKEKHFGEIQRVLSYFGKVQVKKNGKAGGKDFKLFNKGLMNWIISNCYKGGSGFKYKTVPRWVANNSKSVISEFLRAFRDGDGYIHKGRNCYVTSSVNLVDDLMELIYKTGKSGSYYKKSEAGSTFEIEGRIATRTEDNYVIFEYSRNGYGIAGKETKTYEGTVYSIILNSDTKLMFTKNDGAKPFWTHNGGVTDELIRRGYNVMPINFGAKASDPDKYPNLISQAWFYMAQIMPDIQLVQDSDLLMELSSRKWVMDSKGRRGVESKDSYKKRGYRSPDKADATILCFYTPEVHVIDYGWAVA